MNPVLKIFIIVTATLIISELIKACIDRIKHKKFNEIGFHGFLRYGGMPSTHTASVTSLAYSIAIIDGFTISFLLSIAIATTIMRDLVTIRGQIDKNSKNIEKISKGKFKVFPLSHTYFEILAGFILGITITTLLYFAI